LMVAFGLKKYFTVRMNPATNSFRRRDLAT
jgi:hypothetical protein